MNLDHLSSTISALGPNLKDHLWQSTVFAAGAALIALIMHKNYARTRYWIWLAASIKFLVPVSMLVTFGAAFMPHRQPTPAVAAVYDFIDVVGQPFTAASVSAAPKSLASFGHHVGFSRSLILPVFLAIIWALGTLSVLTVWAVYWWRVRSALRRATKAVEGAEILALRQLQNTGLSNTDIQLCLSDTNLGPGVYGIARPILIWPSRISQRLNDGQIKSILAHEICHIERRDNFTAFIHMVVEALFWFHPLVWWLGSRLELERERACDEHVLQFTNAPQTYAESILKVCEMCLESPLECVSGVTGANLKERIRRIMTSHMGQRLTPSHKILLVLAVFCSIGVPIIFGQAANGHSAQTTSNGRAQAPQKDIANTWQGTMHFPKQDLRTVLKVAHAPDGALTGTMYSIDQGGQPIRASSISFQDGSLKMAIQAIDLTIDGKLSGDGNSISGTVVQGGQSIPLVLVRATPETAWTIPEAPKPIPPMAADAKPVFEVATIKPSGPDEQGKIFTLRGDHFVTVNTTLQDMITFAYGVQQKEVENLPDWASTQKYDVNGKPDMPGLPNSEQVRYMLRQALADRFQLKMHEDKKEMSAYVLTVAKGGEKMTAAAPDAGSLPGFGFSGLGILTVQNATMQDFAELMQETVLDRPVVDQAGLTGRYNFLLKWTPDESQFAGLGVKVPPPSDAADAPPPLYTAITEQIGLKLEAGKAPVRVLVVDHVDPPSGN